MSSGGYGGGYPIHHWPLHPHQDQQQHQGRHAEVIGSASASGSAALDGGATAGTAIATVSGDGGATSSATTTRPMAHEHLQQRQQSVHSLGDSTVPSRAAIVYPHMALPHLGDSVESMPTYGAATSTLAQSYRRGEWPITSSSSSSMSMPPTIDASFNLPPSRPLGSTNCPDQPVISSSTSAAPPALSGSTTVSFSASGSSGASSSNSALPVRPSSSAVSIDHSFLSSSSLNGFNSISSGSYITAHVLHAATPTQPSYNRRKEPATTSRSPEEHPAALGSSPTAAPEPYEPSSAATIGGPAPTKKRRVTKPRDAGLPGSVITEKSCARCRIRKVKCDRTFPVCLNCKVRNEECDLISLHPNDKISISAQDQAETERINRLEQRLAEIESQISSGSDQNTAEGQDGDTTSGSSSTSTSSLRSEHGSLVRVNGAQIGQRSVDWRLATPQMARLLSQHLCQAFFSSCCFQMPSFDFFRKSIPAYRDVSKLTGPTQVAIAAFCAVGARASPHSAVLGIAAAPDDGQHDPDLTAGARRQSACQVLVAQAHSLCFEHGLLEDATIETLAAVIALAQMAAFSEFEPRKSKTLLRTAIAHYKELYETAATLDGSMELQRCFGMALYTLDAVLAAYSRRNCMITELDLRHYFNRASIVQPLLPQDSFLQTLPPVLKGASRPEEGVLVSVHLLVCWVAAAQRAFARLSCPPLPPSMNAIEDEARQLLDAVNETRRGVELLQNHIRNSGLAHHHHAHRHDSSNGPSDDSCSEGLAAAAAEHEKDYLARVIRCDRDLLDLIPMLRTFILQLPSPGLPSLAQELTSRVRKFLKINALYAHEYLHGADRHMLYHHAFQLEHTIDWTTLATQRVGDPDGPTSKEEELTPTELEWLVEGLKGACYYTPQAERRLTELVPSTIRPYQQKGMDGSGSNGSSVRATDLDPEASANRWSDWTG